MCVSACKPGSISAVLAFVSGVAISAGAAGRAGCFRSFRTTDLLEGFITRQVAAVKSQFENEIETLRQINGELMAEIDKQRRQL